MASRLRLWLPLILLVALLVAVVALVRLSDRHVATSSPPVAPAPASPPPAAPPAPTAVALFIGDGYTAGTGASSGAARWTSLVSAEMGWLELNVGRRGSGYRAEPPSDVCGYSQCPSFRRMVERAVLEQPDVVVVAGGQNDAMLAHYAPAAEAATIAATYASLREALPDALLIGVGPLPLWGAGDVLKRIDADVEDAVRSVCGVFVSLIEPEPLQNLPGSADEPNDEGHQAIARRVLQALEGRSAEAPPLCVSPSVPGT